MNLAKERKEWFGNLRGDVLLGLCRPLPLFLRLSVFVLLPALVR